MFLRFRKHRTGPDLHDLSDHELIINYRKRKDNEVIAELFTRYTHLVYGVCLKYIDDKDDAKDAVMEIFEELPGSLLKHDIRNFKNWLHSVTRNHCLMKLRKVKAFSFFEDLPGENSDEDFVEFQVFEHQEDEMPGHAPGDLDLALKSLKEQQRQCVELVYLEGKSYEEVCVITGYRYKEVKSHVQNGKRNLKLKLEEINAKRT